MKRTEFAILMTRLRSCYQNAIADQSLWLASMSTYWEMCSTYPADDIRVAFALAWRRHPDWMPSCGQLVGLIEGAVSSRAAEAWPETLRLASSSSGAHSDPIARKAIAMMGGGARLGRMRSDELHVWGKKEFLDLYEQAAKQLELDDVRESLAGPLLASTAIPRLGRGGD